MKNQKNNLKIDYLSIEKIRPNEYNPKTISEKDKEELKKSILEFGIVDPIIINNAPGREGFIIGGHQRYKIYQELGFKKVPVVKLNIPDIEKEKELCLRLSKNTGEWDLNLLADFDKKLLENIGWEEIEIDEIFDKKNELLDEKEKEFEIKFENLKGAKEGDLWLLGEHKLLVADSTKKENIEKLLGGEKVDMVFTDPPYGINIVKVGGSGKTHFGKVGGGKWVSANYYKPIYGDNKEFDPRFLLNLANKILIFGGNYFANYLPNSRCWFCWDKTGEDYIQNNFADCEFIWTNLKKPSRVYRCKWRGLLKEKGEDVRKRIHPTQKPLKLLSDILRDHSNKNDIILDPFGGSGSTLIACETMKRKCRMIEIDPYYGEIIINRWEKFTGKKAVKL